MFRDHSGYHLWMKIFIKNRDNKRDTEIEREKERRFLLFRLPKMRLCLHTHKYLHIGKTSQLNIRLLHSLIIYLILCITTFGLLNIVVMNSHYLNILPGQSYRWLIWGFVIIVMFENGSTLNVLKIKQVTSKECHRFQLKVCLSV